MISVRFLRDEKTLATWVTQKLKQAKREQKNSCQFDEILTIKAPTIEEWAIAIYRTHQQEIQHYLIQH